MAGRYATALFELALDQNALDAVSADCRALERMLTASPDLKRLVFSPVFDREDQMRAIGAVATHASLSGLTQKFLGVLAHNRRLFALENMISVFNVLVARHRGEVQATVTVAQALNEEQTQKLKTVLRDALNSDVLMDVDIDANLLGGMVVRVGSQMFDASLATQLNTIQLAMREA